MQPPPSGSSSYANAVKKQENEDIEAATKKAAMEKIAGSGCVETNYTFKFNKSGTINDSTSEIYVCKYKPDSVASHFKCRELCHPSFLRNIGYDKKRSLSVYMKYTCTLQEYIFKYLADDNIGLVMQSSIPSYCDEKDKLVYYYVPNMYRKFLKSVVEFMFYLCGEGVVLRDLDCDRHLAVQGERLVFHSLVITEVTTDVNTNFKLAASMLEKLFGKLPKPLEVSHFIYCLEGFEFNKSRRELLDFHPAILQTSERLDMVRSYYEQTKFLSNTDSAVQDSVLKDMGDDYKLGNFNTKDWTDFFREPYYRSLGPMYNCFMTRGYQHDGTIRMKNQQLLRYARNSVAHVDEHFDTHTTRLCTRLKADGMIMAILGKSLLDYHKSVSSTTLMKNFF